MASEYLRGPFSGHAGELYNWDVTVLVRWRWKYERADQTSQFLLGPVACAEFGDIQSNPTGRPESSGVVVSVNDPQQRHEPETELVE